MGVYDGSSEPASHLTISSTGQISAVTFCAWCRTKAAIVNLPGEHSVRQPTKKESTSCQNVNSAIQAVSGLVAQALTRSMSIVVWTRKNVFFVARPHMEHAVIAHLKNINMAAAQTNAFTADLHQQAHVVVAHMENMKSRSPNKRLNHVRLAHWTPASRRRLAGRYNP